MNPISRIIAPSNLGPTPGGYINGVAAGTTARYGTRPLLNLLAQRSSHSTRTFDVSQAIVFGGLVAAVLWLVDAMTFCYLKGLPPTRVLHTVAADFVGMKPAITGGSTTMALGLLLHVGIALAMAAIYVAASLKLAWLNRRPMFWGMAYGVVLYLVMNHIVVPMSAIGQRLGLSGFEAVLCIAGHALLVGLPIALFARRIGR